MGASSHYCWESSEWAWIQGWSLLNVPAQILTTLFCSLGEGRGKSVAPVASMSGGAAPHAPSAQRLGRTVPGFGDQGAPMTIHLLFFFLSAPMFLVFQVLL